MKAYTTESVAGHIVEESFGIVTGNVVQSKHIGRDIMAALKSLVGGEIKGYSEMLIEARNLATERMFEDARMRGANAVVNVRYTTSSIAQGMSEILAYGTAVKLAKAG